MKKILSILFIALFVFAVGSVTVAAEPAASSETEQTDADAEDKNITENTIDNAKEFFSGFFSFFEETYENHTIKKAFIESKTTLGLIRQSIEAVLKNEDSIFSYLPSQIIIDATYSVFMPLGLIVFFISWCMSFGDKALNGSLFDEGNAGKTQIIKSLVQLFAGIIFTAIGAKILQLIDTIVQIFTLRSISNTDFYAMQAFIDKIDYEESFAANIPIIGPIISFFNELIGSFQMQIVGIAMIICLAIILITLAVRMIKLAIFKGTSPIFFAMATSDNLKRYTQNFIIRYCILSGQILIISILYSALEITIVSLLASYSNMKFGLSAAATGCLVCIIFTVLIARSEKLFDRVFAT